ncbi:MAG TPA: CHAD domain-containing protein [Actinomycetota bacterium]|nr:CHAD domain-containing protein [Actinomycetota bacterium]
MTIPPDDPSGIVVPDVGPRSTTAQVIERMVASSAQRLIANDHVVRLGVDPEGVHQARVATRRIRSDLRLVRSLVDSAWLEDLRRDLRWLGGALGAVRDLDVLHQRFLEHAAMVPDDLREDVARVLDRLRARRDPAREALLSAMQDPRYERLLGALRDAASNPRVHDHVANERADRTMGPLMHAPWVHLRRVCDGLDAGSPDADLHEARIRAKRVRYAAEALAPIFGEPAHRFARRAEALQDVLGRHQDAVVALAWLRTSAGGSGLDFVAGTLAGIEAMLREDSRRRWPRRWRDLRLRRKAPRFWE